MTQSAGPATNSDYAPFGVVPWPIRSDRPWLTKICCGWTSLMRVQLAPDLGRMEPDRAQHAFERARAGNAGIAHRQAGIQQGPASGRIERAMAFVAEVEMVVLDRNRGALMQAQLLRDGGL